MPCLAVYVLIRSPRCSRTSGTPLGFIRSPPKSGTSSIREDSNAKLTVGVILGAAVVFHLTMLTIALVFFI